MQDIIPRREPPKPERKKRRGVLWLCVSLVIVFSILAGIGYAFSWFSPEETSVTIPPGLTRAGVAHVLGDALSWEDHQREAFAGTFVQMHWMALSKEATAVFTKKFSWGDIEREAFLVQSSKYFDPEFDFLSAAYVPGQYVIPYDETYAGIANLFITRLQETYGAELEEFIADTIPEEVAKNVLELVQEEVELRPDLVPLPAQDMEIIERDGEVFLLFSTIYYNQGKGPLELRADEETQGIREDIERDVFQRIYRVDDTYRDHVAGTFLWHQEHLHYHFADFVEYDLASIDNPDHSDLEGARTKSTFCIRDVSLVDLELPNRAEEAAYLICGKEIQGISVGWADTYYYTYADQNLNLTGLPSGTYRLTFTVNPTNRFEEVTHDNNVSSVLIKLDMEERSVETLEESPEVYPVVEHIYPEQVFD